MTDLECSRCGITTTYADAQITDLEGHRCRGDGGPDHQWRPAE